MNIRNGIIAALMVPVLAAAQERPSTPFNGKTAVERMQKNVAQITSVGEKQRWLANGTMWQTVVANSEALSKADLATLKASLMTMQTNVGTIERPAEAARWHANVALWRAFLAGEQGNVKPTMAHAAFARMKANVATISEPGEKERWQANVDLWSATLAAK